MKAPFFFIIINMKQNFEIGDLVFLEVVNIVGIIIDTKHFGNDIVDVEVQWIDGDRYWCLAQGLTIVSKAIY